MASGRVKLEGVAELKAALEALGPEVATKVGAGADRKAAVLLQNHLIEQAPVGPGRHPEGHLRDNIRVRKQKARQPYTIRYIVNTGKAFWGAFQERGTAKMAARPWMGPTFDAAVPNLISEQVDGLKTGIERTAKRLARLRRK